ncbi:ribulose-1,5 bisphosphate carboxylase oxygenase large subunit N-methyltransferase [Seminavis robusta]|uniref:Ribulose-1,5 bisphosphate carboxylase oxygenase large subunit N-methyltransferase n=1 Tax=Seminavis robusta TaxID=568900 RepID=A0A9N8HCS1_9STRA|nr:ribulose-1,5 bisphosphate carboxylase oxygenase large subunit N-methyltransferase [Seminavis robusta]|eukprot:Sro426_g140310.1 ribulose-1,5 bisphosphate carboxylase oxygenase large subunit N-methyltransferase (499) ;mRNA; f:10310-11806
MANAKKKNRKDSSSSSNKKNEKSNTTSKGMFLAVAVVLLAYLIGGARYYLLASNLWPFQGGNNLANLTPVERLLKLWRAGDKVDIQNITNGNRGLVATQDIEQGSVIVTSNFHDLEGEIRKDYPEVATLVDETVATVVKEQGAKFADENLASKILGILRFLQLVDIKKNPKWVAYAETLPSNVTSMAWYWTDEERKCRVPRPDDEVIYQDRNVFHGVMEKLFLSQQYTLLQDIKSECSKLRLEWGYLMLRTRGFGKLFFVPIMDMSNHDPLRAAPVTFDKRAAKIYMVAARDLQKGDPIYNNYGHLSPVSSAECHGFVQDLEDGVAYFESPSIHRDMWRSERTNSNPQCTGSPIKFFGNTGDQIISAQLGTGKDAHYSTHYKEYRPTQLSHACMRVLIQSEKGSELAKYVVSAFEKDYNRYAAMANAERCQSSEGNFPLIRKANSVMAALLWEAMELAEKAAHDESIPYPGIPEHEEALTAAAEQAKKDVAAAKNESE